MSTKNPSSQPLEAKVLSETEASVADTRASLDAALKPGITPEAFEQKFGYFRESVVVHGPEKGDRLINHYVDLLHGTNSRGEKSDYAKEQREEQFPGWSDQDLERLIDESKKFMRDGAAQEKQAAGRPIAKRHPDRAISRARSRGMRV